MDDLAPRVTVLLPSGSKVEYPRSILDQFESGAILVTNLDSLEEVTWREGEWAWAIQSDSDEYPLYAFSASRLAKAN
jgi:hypothetical protein